MENVSGRRARIAEVRVKLQPELLQQFDVVAQRRGVPAATLAALVIGEFVEKQGENTKLQQMVVLDMSKRLSASFDEAKMASAMNHMDPAVLKSFGDLLSSADAQEVSAGKAGSSAAPEAAAPMRGTSTGDRARSAT